MSNSVRIMNDVKVPVITKEDVQKIDRKKRWRWSILTIVLNDNLMLQVSD